MDLTELMYSIQDSGIAQYIATNRIAFPLIESLHVISLTLVFGTIAIVDLRLLGVPSSRRPFTDIAAETLKWTWIAFAIAVITGLLLFSSNASSYYINTPFRWKMVLLVLAGINMLIFEVAIVRTVHKWNKDVPVPTIGRVSGTFSLLFWTGVIVFGRWIGFTMGMSLPF